MFQSLVTLAPWTVIFQICNLLLQLFLFKKFLYKPVMNILAKRQAAADAQIRDAKQSRDEAEAIKAEYQENMAQAKAQASQLLANAQQTASARSEEIVRAAQAQAVEIKNKAEADIAQERKQAVNQIKDEIGDIALEIASKVVEREISAADHQALIDQFIENVGEAR